MIHGQEDRHLTIGGGKSSGQVGAPHLVDLCGGDRAVVDFRSRAAAPALRRQKLVFPHQTQHAPFRGSDPGISQSSPDLAVSFAMKRGLGQDGLDFFDQLNIAAWPLRSGARGVRWLILVCWLILVLPLPIESGAGPLPNPANPDQGVRFLRRERGGPAHRLARIDL